MGRAGRGRTGRRRPWARYTAVYLDNRSKGLSSTFRSSAPRMPAPQDRSALPSAHPAHLSLARTSALRTPRLHGTAWGMFVLMWVTVIAFASPASGGALGLLSVPADEPAPNAVPGAPSLEIAHGPALPPHPAVTSV